MTQYKPMIVRSATEFGSMTPAEYTAMQEQIAYLFDSSPSVELTITPGTGNLPGIVDRRYYTGLAQDLSDTTFGTATDGPHANDVTFQNITQTLTDPGPMPNYTLKPVRPDGSNGVIEMTEQDVMDTFIQPVIDNMTGLSTGLNAAGSYFIQPNNTPLSLSTSQGLVFTDTNALGNPNYATITSINQQFTDNSTIQNYYLFRINNTGARTFRTPLIIDGSSGLRHMTYAEFDSYFGQLIKASLYGEPGYTLRYTVDTNGSSSGITQGVAMVDTEILGSTQVDILLDPGDADPNDYVSQLQPSGAATTRNTYRLKIEIT